VRRTAGTLVRAAAAGVVQVFCDIEQLRVQAAGTHQRGGRRRAQAADQRIGAAVVLLCAAGDGADFRHHLLAGLLAQQVFQQTIEPRDVGAQR
jgi:hypothetical protein